MCRDRSGPLVTLSVQVTQGSLEMQAGGDAMLV